MKSYPFFWNFSIDLQYTELIYFISQPYNVLLCCLCISIILLLARVIGLCVLPGDHFSKDKVFECFYHHSFLLVWRLFIAERRDSGVYFDGKKATCAHMYFSMYKCIVLKVLVIYWSKYQKYWSYIGTLYTTNPISYTIIF